MAQTNAVLHLGYGQCKGTIPGAAQHMDALATLIGVQTDLDGEHVSNVLSWPLGDGGALEVIGPEADIRQLSENAAARGVAMSVEPYREPAVDVDSMDSDQRTLRWANHFYVGDCIACRKPMLNALSAAIPCPHCNSSQRLAAPVQFKPLPETVTQKQEELESTKRRVQRLMDEGNTAEAVRSAGKLHRLCRGLERGSDTHLEAVGLVAAALFHANDWPQAESVYLELASLHEARFGRVSLGYADAMDWLSSVYAGRRKLGDAEKAATAAAAAYQELEGQQSPNALRCLGHAAKAQSIAGKPAQAAAVYRELAKQHGKSKDPDATVDALLNAGRAHCEASEFAKGRECFVAAMDIGRRTGGKAWIVARHGMALYDYVTGEYDAAGSLLKEVHAEARGMDEGKLPFPSFEAGNTRGKCHAEKSQRNYTPLPELLAAATSLPTKSAVGDGGWSLDGAALPPPKKGASKVASLRSKAERLADGERPYDAIPVAVEACELSAEVNGPMSIDHAIALDQLAYVHVQAQLWDEAERYARVAVTICNESTDARANHWRHACMWRLVNIRFRKFDEPRQYAMNDIDTEEMEYLPTALREIVIKHDLPKWRTTLILMGSVGLTGLILWHTVGWCVGALCLIGAVAFLTRHLR